MIHFWSGQWLLSSSARFQLFLPPDSRQSWRRWEGPKATTPRSDFLCSVGGCSGTLNKSLKKSFSCSKTQGSCQLSTAHPQFAGCFSKKEKWDPCVQGSALAVSATPSPGLVTAGALSTRACPGEWQCRVICAEAVALGAGTIPSDLCWLGTAPCLRELCVQGRT